jgi:sialidase-1
VAKLINPGSSAYSCLTVLKDKTIGLLYEKDNYGKITFAHFDLLFLTESRDSIE